MPQRAAMKPSSSVLIWTGPTGGHFFPAVSFAEALIKLQPNLRYILITSDKGTGLTERLPGGLFSAIHHLSSFPMPSGLSLALILFPFRLMRAFYQSAIILLKERPRLSVGFGSYVAFPGILLSRWMGIRTIIHEQNRIPGKATQFLLASSTVAASSFPKTFDRHPDVEEREIGLPLRSSITKIPFERLSSLSSDPTKPFSLLIMGGSQGAHRLNELVLEAMMLFHDEEKERLAVNHITGISDESWVREKYKKIKIEATVYPFFDKMELVFQKTDAAITRAGANTLFELAYFGIPALLIPYPYAGAHQRQNAEYFYQAEACRLCDEKDLTPASIAEFIRWLRSNPSEQKNLSMRMRELARPQAADRLAQIANDMLKGNYV